MTLLVTAAAADRDGAACVLRPAGAASMATAVAYSARGPYAVTEVAAPPPTSASPSSPLASPSSRRAGLTTATPVSAAAHDDRQHGAVRVTRNAGLTAAAPAQPPDDAGLTDSSTLPAAPARRRSSLPADAANDGDGDAVMLPVTAAAAAAVAHSAHAPPAVLDAAAAAASDAATAAAAVHDAVPDDASAMMTDAVPVTADAELCSGQPDLRAASAAQLESAGARLEADGDDAAVRAMVDVDADRCSKGEQRQQYAELNSSAAAMNWQVVCGMERLRPSGVVGEKGRERYDDSSWLVPAAFVLLPPLHHAVLIDLGHTLPSLRQGHGRDSARPMSTSRYFWMLRLSYLMLDRLGFSPRLLAQCLVAAWSNQDSGLITLVFMARGQRSPEENFDASVFSSPYAR